jgi:hypothetical protein
MFSTEQVRDAIFRPKGTTRCCLLMCLMVPLLPLTAQTVAAKSHYEAEVLADHPVAYYQLGEPPGATVAVDSSGNGNNGTYELNPVLGVPGLINNPAATAVNFAGGGNVTIPDAADLDFVNAPFTIEAWVNGTLSTQPCCHGNARIYDKSDAGYPLGYGLDVASTNVRLLGCGSNFAPAVKLSSNTTYHLVGVSDGVRRGAIYVNGRLLSLGFYSSCSPYTAPAHIAVASDGSAQFDGVIQEVAVYNYVLPHSRILAHYEAGIH